MPLDQNAIDELKKIHLEETGEELTNDEAWEMGIGLLKLMKALGRNPVQDFQNGPDNLTEKPTTRYD